MQPARHAVAALAVITLAACGGSGLDPATDAERQALEGTWQSPCFPTSATQSAQNTLVYKDLQLTGTYLEYSDLGCKTGRHESTWTGLAGGGAEVRPGVRKLDLFFFTFHSKPLTQAEADMVNSWQYCGISDWKANEERDVLGKYCINFSVPVAGVSFDIFQRDGDTLRFGNGSKIAVTLTEADRPTELAQVTYTRLPNQ